MIHSGGEIHLKPPLSALVLVAVLPHLEDLLPPLIPIQQHRFMITTKT
jgi:hypothetical protein